MNNILRKLCAWICVPIYNLIPSIYKIFYNIASARFFDPENTDIVQKLSQNLYVLISVIMLFGFSITILSAIVNPDLISDNKKGVPAMFKRAIIGLALIVIVPFGFDEMYKIQNSVMSNSLVEKIIVGADFSCDKTKNPDCEVGQGGGQVIAGILINSVLRPADDNVVVGVKLQEAYTDMVQSKIENITTIASEINVKRIDGGSSIEDEDYGFHFDSLIAIIAGIGVDYILLIFAIDMAVRMFKLAFLEITAPISIVSYVAVGDKIFMSWLKEVGKTFADVFIKIASIAFYLFLVSNLSTFFAPFKSESWGYVLKAFLIVGMLIFVKQIPNMISAIFGIEMKSQGGIGGRLGQMAMVGDQAKKAWQGIKNVAGLGAAAAGLGLATVANPLLGAAVGGAVAARHGWNKGFGGGKAWKDTKGGQVLSAGAGAAGAFLRGKNGIAGVKDAAKSWGDSSFAQSHSAEKNAIKNYERDAKARKEYNEKIGLDENGRIIPGTLDTVKANYAENLKKDLGKKADSLVALQKADQDKANITAAASSVQKVNSMLDEFMEHSSTKKGAQQIADLKSQFNGGKLTREGVRAKLEELCHAGEITEQGAVDLSREVAKFENIVSSSNQDDIKGLVSVDDEGNHKLNIKGVDSCSKKYEAVAATAKADYDSVYSSLSESNKEKMDRYKSTSDAIVNETVRVSKQNDNNTEVELTEWAGRLSSPGGSQNNTTSNVTVSNDDTDDAFDAMMNAQIEVNEDRLNNAWENQTTDDTYRRGTYEPEKNNNSYDDNYDDIFADQYENNDSNTFNGSDE